NVLHVPYLFSRPLWTPCPYVVTAHDLLTFTYPVRNGSGVRRSLHQWFTARALHHADRIFAVSHFTRNELVRLHHVAAEKIRVVYNAIDDRLSSGHATPGVRELIAESYQVNYPFLFYVCNNQSQ